MHLVRRNGNSVEDVVTRALHLRLRLRFASLILIPVRGILSFTLLVRRPALFTFSKVSCVYVHDLMYVK